MLANIVAWCLNRSWLSIKDKNVLVTAVINTLDIPTRSILTTDENRRILVQGVPLSIEQTQQLQESAFALTNNQALHLIRDQVRFTAVQNGFLTNVDADPIRELFYKAALWYAQEEKVLIASLAGSQDSTL
jgi:hypothetical protein